jgi:dTDP-4-dehydrorhamnose 3,5-epimerase
MIKDIIKTPLKQIENPKGSIYHALKSNDDTYKGFGEAYFSFINYKEVKGWKKHTKMFLNLIVPVGIVKFVVFDDRENSDSENELEEFIISNDNYYRLTIPPDLWVAFQGLDKSNIILNIANILHNPLETESKELNMIKYNWNK